MSKVTQHDLDRLHDEFLNMRDAKARVRREVERRYREKIEQEIEFESRGIERAFAVQLVELREAGATRKELVKVIGDGTASTMRHYIELGGGTVQKKLTGAERAEERKESLGVRHVGGNEYMWNVDGVEYLSQLLWQNGKPVFFPVGEAARTLRDLHGFGAAEFRAKGAEVANAFDVKEEA